MDILHLCHQFAPETRGGVEFYVKDLIAAQRAAGRDVEVLTGSHEPWPEIGMEQVEVRGVKVHRLHRDDLYFDLYSKSWHPGVEAVLEKFLNDHRPRVVHIHQWIRLAPNLVEIVQRCGIPAVLTLHDYYASCPRAFRLKRGGGSPCFDPLSVATCQDCVPRYGYESSEEIASTIEMFRRQKVAEVTMADEVLVCVSSTADLVASALELPRERFRIMSLGYERRFAGQPPLPGPQPGEPIRFAFWGGVAAHKGIRALVDAVRQLASVTAPGAFEVHVLGGFETPEFEAELRAAGDGLPITFHGPFHTEDLRTVGPAVGVFPSTCLETFGIVLDECFELGLPCIVSDLGALAARAGSGGLIVPAGDAVALAAAMRRFLDEPGLWQELRGQLPALSPDLAEHVLAMDEVYDRAKARRERAGPPTGGIPLLERIRLLHRQRESAMGRLPPPTRD